MTYHGKALFSSFKQFLNQIYKDAMLIILCLAPLLCGLFFKFGIPVIQRLLTRYLGLSNLIQAYYLLFDLLLASLTPLMYGFAAAYVILGEIDEGISKYFAVTPIGKKGYLISRLIFPTIIAFLVSVAILELFRLSEISHGNIIIISILTALLGIVEALLVVSISSNKVEGMAVSKLSGLFFLGLPVPFFLNGNIQYLLILLPSFWISKYALMHAVKYAVLGFVIAIIWIIILYRKFKCKIM